MTLGFDFLNSVGNDSGEKSGDRMMYSLVLVNDLVMYMNVLSVFCVVNWFELDLYNLDGVKNEELVVFFFGMF